MNYDEMKEHAKYSDHQQRIISELEQPLKDALARTPPSFPVLEIGNREGGSAAVQLYYIGLEDKKRRFVTVDSGDAVRRIAQISESLGIDWKHYKSAQTDWVKQNVETFGFIFLDADHDQTNVSRDMRILAPYLAEGGVMAVDDCQEWKEIPSFEEVGLHRVYYEVDMDNKKDHICYWLKINIPVPTNGA